MFVVVGIVVKLLLSWISFEFARCIYWITVVWLLFSQFRLFICLFVVISNFKTSSSVVFSLRKKIRHKRPCHVATTAASPALPTSLHFCSSNSCPLPWVCLVPITPLDFVCSFAALSCGASVGSGLSFYDFGLNCIFFLTINFLHLVCFVFTSFKFIRFLSPLSSALDLCHQIADYHLLANNGSYCCWWLFVSMLSGWLLAAAFMASVAKSLRRRRLDKQS